MFLCFCLYCIVLCHWSLTLYMKMIPNQSLGGSVSEIQDHPGICKFSLVCALHLRILRTTHTHTIGLSRMFFCE